MHCGEVGEKALKIFFPKTIEMFVGRQKCAVQKKTGAKIRRKHDIIKFQDPGSIGSHDKITW